MISAYGPEAERYAAGLNESMRSLAAIITVPERIPHAYIEAVRRRSAGEAFYGMILLGEGRDRLMTSLAAPLLLRESDDDRRRWFLNNITRSGVQVNGKTGPEILELNLSAELRQSAREFLQLCPAILVRSAAEYERVSVLSQYRRPYEMVLLEPALPPAVERRVSGQPSIVIWAPERDAAGAALHAFSLAEIHGEVTLVSADGVVPNGAAVKALRAGDPRVAEALAGATCVVTADATDPGAAVAFARRGYGVAAAASAGAHEFLRDVQVYDPSQSRQIYVAAMMAIGKPASIRVLPQPPPRTPPGMEMGLDLAGELPPVTVIVPTFNRPDDLERCLFCIGRQTYPNVRAIVVNDAGSPIEDIVARFRFARALNMEKNGGAIEACMAGLKLVTDGFVQFLADDDWLYPDHVAQLAGTMIRSGAAVAHSNVLIRYVERGDDGAVITTGYNAGVFIETTTPSEALVCTPIAGNGLMWRRSIFDVIGGWREDCGLADQEVQLRAAQRYAFAYIDQITAEWRVHASNFSRTADTGAEQRRVYEELHPVEGRPVITQRRNEMLENIRDRPPGYIFEATLIVHKPAT